MFARNLRGMACLVLRSSILWALLLCSGRALADSPPDPPAQQAEQSGVSGSEQEPVLRSGDLVRLKTTLFQGRFQGVIRSLDVNQVIVEDKRGEQVAVPWPDVKRLKVQTGLRRRWGAGLAITVGIGAVLGLAKPEKDETFCVPFGGCRVDEAPSRSSQVVIGAGIGVVAGLIGVGASAPSAPKWTRVRLPYRSPPAASPGFGIAPRQDGVVVETIGVSAQSRLPAGILALDRRREHTRRIRETESSEIFIVSGEHDAYRVVAVDFASGNERPVSEYRNKKVHFMDFDVASRLVISTEDNRRTLRLLAPSPASRPASPLEPGPPGAKLD